MGVLTSGELASIRETFLPFANARLTAVNGPATIDGYGNPTNDGSTVWSGSVPAFLRRSREMENARRMSAGDANDYLDVFELVVIDGTGAPLDVIAGPDGVASSVTVQDRSDPANYTTGTWQVIACEHDTWRLIPRLILRLRSA